MNTWLKSLLAATIGGAANAFALMGLMPDKFNFGDMPSLGKVIVAGAIIGLMGYLKQSPLPGVDPQSQIGPTNKP